MKTAILLSGGMDSISVAYWKRPQVAITIDYGQRPADAEIRAATAVAEDLEMDHFVIHADMSSLGSGDMAGSAPLAMAPVTEWWPFRNQMLITLAAMKAVTVGVNNLLVGTLRTDGMHLDGTVEFIESVSKLTRLQEGGLTVEAPAIELDAVELVRISSVPKEILGWAHSCHVSDFACGICRGCRKHYETWRDLGEAPF